MPQSIRSGSSFDSLIPALTDNADIVKALKDYHYGTISHPTTQGQENALTTGIVGLLNSKIGASAPTFTGTVTIAGQNTRYQYNLLLNESTWTQASPSLSSNRVGILFGEAAGSWTMGQDSEGNGTRDFFIFGGASPTDPTLRFHIAVDGSVSIPNNSLNVGTGTTSGAYRIQASATNAGLGLVSSSSAGSDNGSWIDFVNSSYTQTIRGNIYYNYVTDALSIGTSATGSTGARADRVTINSTGTTFAGTVTVPSGTDSAAPLKFNTGTTKLSTIQPGTVEYDGNIFYATPKVNNTTAGRGLIETPYVYVTSADTQVVISTAQSVGGGGNTTDTDSASAFGKYIYLAANSTYMIEANVMISHTFSRTVAGGAQTAIGGITFNFQYPSGTTFSLDMSEIKNKSASLSTAPFTTLSPYIYTQATAAAGDISLKPTDMSTTTGYSMFRIRGIVRTSSTAGNFAPVLKTNANVSNDDDGQNRFISRGNILKDSFIKVTPLGGTTSDVNIGGWA